ncbi:phospholipid-transporting ATPase ABCA3-like [Drosophila tropicalis]|uniref:phospholipid-transporting ATPase ABCA3-like n=1 Tax=Drosophila tropicalis TaxID=46794 RepID=UPI0035ABAE8A
MAREATGDGLQFSNMMKPVSDDDSLAIYQIILMMSLSGLVYMIICLYVEQIYPGPYGAARPWNYPLKCKFWGDLFKRRNPLMDIGNVPLLGNKVHPNSNSRNNVGIELRNLQKTYGENKVVKNLNLKLYRNEITVLLGHNGAGKSTTLNMLTGIIPPTAGTALINGKDICTQVDAARRSLGICPQHDVLFNDMTVRHHIVFFSRLKGVRGEAVEREVQKYMQIMELEHKSKVTAKNLSGGMKRKLSLCCALCGNTRAVLCDEPSSGIDAAGRRRLWDLLLAEKIGRTVLLTTHYMDEANVLGDRIAILSNGELQCYGTPFDLKKRYGLGYRLVCVTEDGCDVNALTEVMAKHIPNIEPESTIGSEVIYRLPSEYTSKYAALLNDLDRGSHGLKLDGYGISVATIEDVFVKMNVENGLKFQGGNSTVLNSLIQLAKNKLMNTLNVKNEEQRQFRNLSIFDLKLPDRNFSYRFVMHCQALIYKNVWITLRNYWVLILQILIPIVFTSLIIINSRGGRIYYELPEILISPLQYRESVAVIEDRTSNSPLANAYASYVESFGARFTLINTNNVPFEEFILDTAKGQRQTVDAKYIAGVTIDESKLTVWLNNQPFHTAPLTLNVLHNAFARQYMGENAGTAVCNGPLPYSEDTLPLRLNKGQKLGAEIALNVSLTMSFITSFFVLPVIKERATRAKLLQYLTGLNIFSYWFSQWVWDYIIFIFIAILYILTIAAYQELGYSHFSDLIRYFVFLLIFGIPALPLSYVLSYFFMDGATGLTRTAIATALTGTAFFTLILSLQFESFQLRDTADELTWYFRIFPHFCLANGLHNIHIGFNIRRGCSFSGIKKLSTSSICAKVPICCNIPGYFAWRHPGILPEIVFLVVVAICLFLILMAIDAKFVSNSFAFLKSKWKSRRSEGGAGSRSSDPLYKDGIRGEIERIQNFTDEQLNQMPLVLNSISKRYGKLIAVNNLSFFVDHGECFGLLGINGAGKTTTFKMLTGDSKITSGSAYVVGLNLKTQMRKVFPKIGYCPQFNALFEELTGRETLRIFCLLRCIQRYRIKRICNDLANFFGFQPHVDKRVKHYSGGNKRKLSVAISFIGNPMVLYLDEPTCGMDPSAQRQLWQILATIRSHGKSSVLTTHSMEECEALCTRIAIMISGQLKCIGSIQQIKNNYSNGLILKIRVKVAHEKLEISVGSSESSDISNADNTSGNQSKTNTSAYYTTNAETNIETDDEKIERKGKNRRPSKELNNEDIEVINNDTKRVRKIKDFIAEKVPDAVLREEVNEMLTYLLPSDSIAWSEIFQLMESNRERLHIEDYVITQTRLEEIFLNFVWDDINQSRTERI